MSVGPGLPGIEDRGTDPVAGLVESRVGQPDQVHAGHPAGNGRLHIDEMAVHTDQGHGPGLRQCHGQHTPFAWSTSKGPQPTSPITSIRISADLTPWALAQRPASRRNLAALSTVIASRRVP